MWDTDVQVFGLFGNHFAKKKSNDVTVLTFGKFDPP